MEDGLRLQWGGTLPVFLESVVNDMRNQCARSASCFSHIRAVLSERHCKITKNPQIAQKKISRSIKKAPAARAADAFRKKSRRSCHFQNFTETFASLLHNLYIDV